MKRPSVITRQLGASLQNNDPGLWAMMSNRQGHQAALQTSAYENIIGGL
jgi:hypothetical protein